MKKFNKFLDEAGRCWPGYKPVPGKKPFSLGSCRKEEVEQIDEISKETAGKYLTAPQGKGANKYKVSSDKSVYPNIETMSKHSTNVRRALKRSEGSSLYKKPDYYKEEVEELDEAKKMEYDQKKVNHLKYIVGILEKEKKEFSRLKGSKEVMDIIDKSINLFAKEYTKHLNALSAGRGQDTNFSVHEEVEELDEKMISVRNATGHLMKVASQFKDIYKKHGYKPVPGTRFEDYEEDDGPLTEDQLEQIEEVAAWQRKEGKSEAGGLNRKGIESYRRENPGSKLSMAVTTKPSKLKPGSKAANRRKSFCARMGGMKRRLTSAKTARDPDSRINKALRKWNC